MIFHYFIFKFLYLACYLDVSVTTTRVTTSDDGGGELHRIPNPEEVLNRVLTRLEQKRQATDVVPLPPEPDFDSHEEQVPDYNEPAEKIHVRKLRKLISQVPFQKHYPICHLERSMRKLTTQDYEYRPAFYEEVKCIPKLEPYETSSTITEICTSLGFSCIQLNKTIHLTRRRFDNDCWETKTLVINAGCECMWPAQQLGDIKYHLGPL